MPANLMEQIINKTDLALASGDLQPLQTEEATITDAGISFIIRWASTLAVKDNVKEIVANSDDNKAEVILPGGPRNADFNPFLQPDPELLVGEIGGSHNVILNKFPVCLHHLVIARKEFAEQLSPLEQSDFIVLAEMLSAYGGLGFYNGGAAAGASQRHKHVQWLPAKQGNASLDIWISGLPTDSADGYVTKHPKLSIKHCFIKVAADLGSDIGVASDSLQKAFTKGLQKLELDVNADGLLPAFNMLVSAGWMLLVPRTQEHFKGVSLNATSFGGTIYVRQKDQINDFKDGGVLAALAAVSAVN